MADSDSWFERNQGFVTFTGHLVAIGQRNALLQQQSQAQQLLQRGIALEEEQREAQTRQEHCKNILYEINQAAALASADYGERPEQAYHEALLLRDKISEIQLHHSWFSELDWKEYCTKTIASVSDLAKHGEDCLETEQFTAIQRSISDQRATEQKRLEAQRSEEAHKATKSQVKYLESEMSKFQLAMIGCGGFVLASLFLFANNEAGTAWLGLIFFGFGGIVAAFRYLDSRDHLRKIVKETPRL